MSETGRLMRVATPDEVIDAALEVAISNMKLDAQQRQAAVTLQQRLELTPTETSHATVWLTVHFGTCIPRRPRRASR